MERTGGPKAIPDWFALFAVRAVGAPSRRRRHSIGRRPCLRGITAFCVIQWVATPVSPGGSQDWPASSSSAWRSRPTSPSLASGSQCSGRSSSGSSWGRRSRGGIGRTIECRLFTSTAPVDRSGVAVPPAARRPLYGWARLRTGATLVACSVMAPLRIEVGRTFESRRPRLGILFGPLFSTLLGAVGVLTAFPSNIVTTGILEATTGHPVSGTS